MGGISEKDDRGGEVVWGALDADEREVRVAVEGGDEVGGCDQGRDAGEVLVEEGGDERAGGVGLEVLVEGGRGEERACECAVLGG